MKRGQTRRSHRYRKTHAATEHREAIERRWRDRLRNDIEAGEAVAVSKAADEPYHRWLKYRQGFAPALVRQYLDQPSLSSSRSNLPILDPFSGSGTTVVEGARHGVRVIGIEASAALVFLTEARFGQSGPGLAGVPIGKTWQDLAPFMETESQRAALMLAEARRHTGDGRPRKDAPAIMDALHEVAEMMTVDQSDPLPKFGEVHQGDATEMSFLEDASIGGILTSPPYLSRYDYALQVQPCERVFRAWYSVPKVIARSVQRIPASPSQAARLHPKTAMPVAAQEAAEALEQEDQPKLAGLVRSYFAAMFRCLDECRRLLVAGSPFWMVIGGARVKGVYVPADLILAEFAESLGFQVQEIRVARRLIEAGRKLGGLYNVSPRESILVMTA